MNNSTNTKKTISTKSPRKFFAKKNTKIIIVLGCLSAILIVLGVVKIILSTPSEIDYAGTYQLAKETKAAVDKYYSSTACHDAEYYIESDAVSDEEYNNLVNSCIETEWGNPTKLIEKLGSADAIMRDAELKSKYAMFHTVYKNSLISSDGLPVRTRLNLYKAWRAFIFAARNLSDVSTDASIAAAAESLMNSESDELKAYAEAWIAKRIALSRTQNAWETTYYGDAYQAMIDARNDFDNFVNTSRPEILDKSYSNVAAAALIKTEFNKLYSAINNTYESH